MAAAAYSAPIFLSRASSRRSELRYEDPWTEPLDDELPSSLSPHSALAPLSRQRSHSSTSARRSAEHLRFAPHASNDNLPHSPAHLGLLPRSRRGSLASSQHERYDQQGHFDEEMMVGGDMDPLPEGEAEEEGEGEGEYDREGDGDGGEPDLYIPDEGEGLGDPAEVEQEVQLEDELQDDLETTAVDDADPPVTPTTGVRYPPSLPRRRTRKGTGLGMGKFKKQLSLPRTMSVASTLSFRSFRKEGGSWVWKVWMFLFPPEGGEDDGFIPNYRYTPIMSGIVVPFAILLEIPGLTEHWYIRTENNITVDFQANPTILDVGLAVSMTCAVIANIALIGRFLERRILLMTVIAACALCIHDIINITAVTVFGVVHRFNDGFTYGEAFWMTVCSTISSTFVTVTLLFDLFHTKNFSHSGSGLTPKQRSLVIVVMILICYVALGALVFSFAMGLSFQDALYFTIVSIETIGFGDIVPTTDLARIFTCFYVVFGIFSLALAVTTTRETIIESFENTYRIRRAKIHRRRKEHRDAKAKAAAELRRLREAGLAPPPPVKTGRGGAGNMRARKNTVPEANVVYTAPDYDTVNTDGSVRVARGGVGNLRASSQSGTDVGPESPGGMSSVSQATSPTGFSLKHAFTWNSGLATAVPPSKPVLRLTPAGPSNEPLASPEAMVTPSTPALTVTPATPDMSAQPPVPTPTPTLARAYSMPVNPSSPTTPKRIIAPRGHRGERPPPLIIPALAPPLPGSDSSAKRLIAPRGHRGERQLSISSPSSAPIIHDVKAEAQAMRDKMLAGKDVSPHDPHEESYLEFRRMMEREEKTEFIAKVTVAWSIFFSFWMAGAAIFMKTEDWTFATGMYFCFIAFSTIGYGDRAPASPAGRSIFTVWALMGVAAMTILVSVLSEAFTSRYKSVLSHGVLEKAVKTFREREHHDYGVETPHPRTELPDPMSPNSVKEKDHHLMKEIEALPSELLRHARAFHEHIHFFTKASHHGPTPPALQKVFDEIAEAEQLDQRQKESLMGDEEARKTLFMMSYERTLHKLIQSAEKAVDLLALRDREHKMLVRLAEPNESAPRRLSGLVPPPLDRNLFSEPAVPMLDDANASRSSSSDRSAEPLKSFDGPRINVDDAKRPRVRINMTEMMT